MPPGPGSGEPEAAGAAAPAHPAPPAASTGGTAAEGAPDADPAAAPVDGGAVGSRDAAPSGGPPAEDALHRPARPLPATVADLVAGTLRAAGVRLAFTVPGESFLPLLDAVAASGIRVVATRHEGAAAFAAEAYGQLTGRPAACLGTRIVGAANLAIGIHTARADSTPLFALVGQVPRRLRGREAFQASDLVASVGSLAAWAAELDDPAEAAELLGRMALAAAGGRPGPALLALPEDVLELPLPEGTRIPRVRPEPVAVEPAAVGAVLRALAAARRPVIVAGAGVLRARATAPLVRLAELLEVPVVASWRRGDVFPNDHPLYLGMAGYGSPAVVRERLAVADLLVAIGTRLGEPTTGGYAIPVPGSAWIHVDVEPRAADVADAGAPRIAVRADARAFLRAATARLEGAALLAGPASERAERNRSDRAEWERATVVDDGAWEGPGIHPGRLVTTLRRLLPDDGILTTDAGAFGTWAARGFRFRAPGTFLGPTSGAMGYALPAAIAASLAHPGRRIVALAGDGGLGMVLAELETAVRVGARVVVLVLDNERYGMIRDHQDRIGSPSSPGTDLGPLDFAAAARACGARGLRVDRDDEVEGILRAALAAPGTTLVHLPLDRRWLHVDRPASARP